MIKDSMTFFFHLPEKRCTNLTEAIPCSEGLLPISKTETERECCVLVDGIEKPLQVPVSLKFTED